MITNKSDAMFVGGTNMIIHTAYSKFPHYYTHKLSYISLNIAYILSNTALKIERAFQVSKNMFQSYYTMKHQI